MMASPVPRPQVRCFGSFSPESANSLSLAMRTSVAPLHQLRLSRSWYQGAPADGRSVHQARDFEGAQMAQALRNAETGGHGNRTHARPASGRNSFEDGQSCPVELIRRSAGAVWHSQGVLTELRDQFEHLRSAGDEGRLSISDHEVRSS